MNQGAKAFFMCTTLFLAFTLGLLVESAFNDSTQKANLKLTREVQDQYWQNRELQQNLSVCNYELGNEKYIELDARVTKELKGFYDE